jgi:DNA-binding CsgD family transcriptional regulator
MCWAAGTPGRKSATFVEQFGLTPRVAEVLTLVAHGLANRDIATTLVISSKTARVHVSHTLRRIEAPNRLEAAAIAHRLDPPHGGHWTAPVALRSVWMRTHAQRGRFRLISCLGCPTFLACPWRSSVSPAGARPRRRA